MPGLRLRPPRHARPLPGVRKYAQTGRRITRQCTGPGRRVQFLAVDRGSVPARPVIGTTLARRMTTGTLSISRPVQWSDRRRHYRILIDGVEAGRIDNGGTFEVELAAGDHEVTARIDWCRSKACRVSISRSVATRLEVGANAAGPMIFAGLYFATLGWWHYLYLRRPAEGFPLDPTAQPAAS